MGKIFINITLIIFLNLFAFLGVWHILDAIFQTWFKMKLILIIASIVPLIIIMHFYLKKVLKDLNNIKNDNTTNTTK